MSSSRFPIPQGTLDMLILQILSLEPAHGYGVAQRLHCNKSLMQLFGPIRARCTPPSTDWSRRDGLKPNGSNRKPAARPGSIR